MKTYFATLILLLTLLFQLDTQAQDPAPKKDPKFFAGITLGPSFPMGKFANKNFADTTAGLAKVGPSLNVTAGYMFTPSIGVMVLFGGQENKMDPNSITSYLNQRYGDSVGTYAATKSWKTGRILAGGVFKFPLSKGEKLFFQGKILAGLLKTTYPDYNYAYGQVIPGIGNPGNYNVRVFAASTPLDWAFCYQANAGLGWQLNRHISLVGDLSYFHAEAHHKYDHYLVFNPGGTPTDHGPWQKKYEVASLNLSVGAEFYF